MALMHLTLELLPPEVSRDVYCVTATFVLVERDMHTKLNIAP